MLPWRYEAEMGTETRYTLQRNTASLYDERFGFWFAVLFLNYLKGAIAILPKFK